MKVITMNCINCGETLDHESAVIPGSPIDNRSLFVCGYCGFMYKGKIFENQIQLVIVQQPEMQKIFDLSPEIRKLVFEIIDNPMQK